MPSIRAVPLVLAVLLLCGCATLPPNTQRSPRDPWERMNRATYRFNDVVDKKVYRPVARGYQRATPQFLQTGVRNFFSNIDYPLVMLNDLLQGQLRGFANDTGRFVLNSTVGIGGIFDPATAAGLDRNERDLGQTLGKWGVPSGPYVVIPFLGPSDVRDGLGRFAEAYAAPRYWIYHQRLINASEYYGTYLLYLIDYRVQLLSLNQLLDSSYDPYAFMRNTYLQRRDHKVKADGGPSPGEQQQEDELLKEAEQAEQEPN